MKKFFYVFFTIILIMLIYSTSALATSQQSPLVKLDVQTGEITSCPINPTPSTFVTPSNQATPSSRAVFNSDTRKQVPDTTMFPYSTVCRIEGINPYDNTPVISTATMIGPKVAILLPIVFINLI